MAKKRGNLEARQRWYDALKQPTPGRKRPGSNKK